MLIFGRGAVFASLNKQKVDSTSSTVVEIIGIDDAMNFVMWVKLFIEQQVVNFPVKSKIKKLGAKPSVLQQDNTSGLFYSSPSFIVNHSESRVAHSSNCTQDNWKLVEFLNWPITH